jgi:DNA-binding MarR family transcriptional regulator
MKQCKGPSSEQPEIEPVLHRKPGYMIRRLQQIAVSIFLEETSEFEITPIQYATLAAVSIYPGIDQLRVANAIGVDRATISGVIDRLQARKLMVRRVSGQDQRANELYTAPAGIELLHDIEAATERVQERILSPLTAGQRTAFLSSLNQLVLSHNHTSRVPIDKALIPLRGSRTGGKKGRSSHSGG